MVIFTWNMYNHFFEKGCIRWNNLAPARSLLAVWVNNSWATKPASKQPRQKKIHLQDPLTIFSVKLIHNHLPIFCTLWMGPTRILLATRSAAFILGIDGSDLNSAFIFGSWLTNFTTTSPVIFNLQLIWRKNPK